MESAVLAVGQVAGLAAVAGLSTAEQASQATRSTTNTATQTTAGSGEYAYGGGYSFEGESGGYGYGSASASAGIYSYMDSSSVTTTAVTHYGLLGALGGTTSVLATGGLMGASALAVYAAFKLGKEEADRKACSYACGFDHLGSFDLDHGRLIGEKPEEEIARKNRNELLSEITAQHLGNAILSLKAEKTAESSSSLKDNAAKFTERSVYKASLKSPGAEIQYILSLFSESPDYNIYLASQTAGRCLMKCPADLTWKFMCKVVNHLPDIETTLRLGQILSASHHNLVSFDTVKNTNLVRFLREVKGGNREDRNHKMKYGQGEHTLCSTAVIEQHDSQKAGTKTSLQDKIQSLIDFQLALEDKAQLKETQALEAEYNPSMCSDCTPSEKTNMNTELSALHQRCQNNIRTLKTNNHEHAEKTAISLFFKALNDSLFSKKKEHYDGCIAVAG